jgi:hypothetical protein
MNRGRQFTVDVAAPWLRNGQQLSRTIRNRRSLSKERQVFLREHGVVVVALELVAIDRGLDPEFGEAETLRESDGPDNRGCCWHRILPLIVLDQPETWRWRLIVQTEPQPAHAICILFQRSAWNAPSRSAVMVDQGFIP